LLSLNAVVGPQAALLVFRSTVAKQVAEGVQDAFVGDPGCAGLTQILSVAVP
jgi:hypothetical protein